jgi:cysteine desulfurase family protein
MSICRSKNLYFDNATTSYPKPDDVVEAISKCLSEVAGSYGRGFTADNVKIAEIFYQTREALASLFNTKNADNIVFTPNATTALNTIIFGLNLHQKHILISPMEHNAVMRPLEYLKKQGSVEYETIKAGSDGLVNPEQIKKQIKKKTALIIINHVSNVNGVIQDIHNIKKYAGDIPLLVDAAQSAGIEKIDVSSGQIDYLVFTGHKGIMGATGIGGFFVNDPSSLKPFIYGGTGSLSSSLDMPNFTPDMYEAGTPNISGIFGLCVALSNKINKKIIKIQVKQFIDVIKSKTDFIVHCADDKTHQSTLVSFSHKSKNLTDVAEKLYHDFGIITRAGIHCAPMAHKHLGSFPNGTIRISFSPYHSPADIYYLQEALLELSTLSSAFDK